MQLSDREASSSDMPPDRKVMPGTAGGTVCCSTRVVARPISAAVDLGVKSEPARTMLGFKRVPSRSTW